MSRPVIRVENVSKLYHLGELGTGQLSTDFSRWWAKTFKGHDPYAKIDAKNEASSKEYWALKDITFDVNQGDVLGIIGKNGAGKSTLLKILSRITTPTSGHIKVKGRIASLLEVGTGFHPDLTGRENVYLNGSFLGMRKREIDAKFDEIVDFSGIEKFIDTPVKRYSSGMYVRLAFAVAAHLEPEILIVDEVLAVGDAEFQKKCLGKMQDVSKNGGRTVLFVSHSMGAIQKLCTKGLFLKNGKIFQEDSIEKIIPNYLNVQENQHSEYDILVGNPQSMDAFATKVKIEDIFGNPLNEIPVGSSWKVKVHFTVNKPITGIVIGLGMLDSSDTPIRTSWQIPNSFEPGDYIASFEENTLKFSTGKYKLLVGISKGSQVIHYVDNDMWISIIDISEGLEESVINSSNGIITNQMNMYVSKI